MSRRQFMRTSGVGVAAVGLTGFGYAGNGPAADANESKERLGMKDQCKITLVQLTDQGDAADNVARMAPFLEQAADYGADLVVFPEYVLGNRVGIGDANVQRFMAMAREHRIYAIAGLVEAQGTQWATTALVVDRQGNLLGRYLKCHPASGPAPHWWPPVEGQDAEARGVLGNQFKVFHLDFGPVGILQCYDGYFPEAWGCTSYAGAEIILWINGRAGMIEDSHCMFAAQAYGCVVGANITAGKNTGFAGPGCVRAEGTPEEARLFPRIKEQGDACVSATINLAELRWKRKHLRTMHQRRPELYGPLTRDVRMWQDYPDIPWDFPECPDLVNKAQL
ncbi:MAG: carbon-nitrogen hydrolase family protein [bacterium]|nr:carbon-nitrogen hydrolase family protein [bacterium]